MQNLWNDQEALSLGDDLLAQRVYSSRLLGQSDQLVLHGGGNTSVKDRVKNLFGDIEDVIYVKGSGWDLASIEKPGFPAVKLDLLKRLASLEHLSDTDMVRMQKSAMLDPSAPTPSVEAILHAIIPYRFVDHTHADAVVCISNTPSGLQRIRDIYQNRVLIIPYTMPGFVLAKKVHQLSQECDWTQIEGMVLMNHGVFSFAEDAKTSYSRMIDLVTEAEEYLKRNHAWVPSGSDAHHASLDQSSALKLAELRKALNQGKTTFQLKLNMSKQAVQFSERKDVAQIACRGPLTPDHVIRTKRIPMLLNGDINEQLDAYKSAYLDYFNAHSTTHHTCLDPLPKWIVWPGQGVVCVGKNATETNIISDITEHTMQAIVQAEKLEQWQSLPEKDIFEVEYWELEQAKLGKAHQASEFEGRVVIVTGAASGIGKACVTEFLSKGAAVLALDISTEVTSLFSDPSVLALQCDVTDVKQIDPCLRQAIERFGGLDCLISNAGTFPASKPIEWIDDTTWNDCLEINLNSHKKVLSSCIPYLKQGAGASVIFIASKNVLAPGPGAAAYSTAKAGVTQLARVAAMELAGAGIRVNVLHPNAVFDTAIWTDEILQLRASHYGMSVEAYKKNNLLHTQVTSQDVALLARTVAGRAFEKITGAQIPIDGGNDRVI